MMMDDQITLGQLQRFKDIQFSYSYIAGQLIRITELGAEKMYRNVLYDGVAYGECSLKRKAEFEVEIVVYSRNAAWKSSLQLGIMRCKKDVSIKSDSGYSIPSNSYGAKNHCIWGGQQLYNNLVTPSEKSEYGYIDLDDLREGDRAGLRLSQDGVLEFTVNGESQGIAARNIYIGNRDVYAVVDHCGSCVATRITKAGEP